MVIDRDYNSSLGEPSDIPYNVSDWRIFGDLLEKEPL